MRNLYTSSIISPYCSRYSSRYSSDMISNMISSMKRGQIHDIWHDFMKNSEFWYTKKCPGKEFISEFIYEFMKNHEFKYEFIKKTYDLGCTKTCPVKEFYFFTYEFMNTQNMNSYMINSYMNKHNMAIRVFQIWQSGCSRSKRRHRLWLWRSSCCKSISQ